MNSAARRAQGARPLARNLTLMGVRSLFLPTLLALLAAGRAEALWPWSKASKGEVSAPQKETPKPKAAARPRPEPAAAKAREGDFLQPATDLVDVPTASILDYGGFSSRTRFFSGGGALEWGSFGVFQRLNIGASLNVDRLLGTQTPVQVTRPELQVKLRFYDGDRSIPAVALGFDGQGYLYNRPNLLYNQKQRGLYLVGTQEVLLPGLEAHAGANMSDFNSNSIFGFASASYGIEDKVLLMAEWDNIHNYADSRFNSGLRVFLTPSFNFDFAARGIGQGGFYSNGVSRGAERIIQFKYTGNF